MLKKIKSILRILFPIVKASKSFHEHSISCLPNFTGFEFIDDNYIVKFKSDLKIALRDFNHSDLLVYNQVFIEEQYKVVVELLRQFKLENYKIIDAGSNVGYTALYLERMFLGEIQIIAIEPNDNNIRILKRNLNLNNIEKSVTVLHKALSSDNGKRFVNSQDQRDKLDWANVTIENDEGDISAVTVTDIVTNQNWDVIDFLKIDIEGHERELFQQGADLDYLNLVRIIAIEVHEDVMSKLVVELILLKFGFLFFNIGELTVGVNKKFLQ